MATDNAEAVLAANYKVRLINFRKILNDQHQGNMAKFARALKRTDAFVWQVTNEYRNITEKTARDIERSLKLAPGELDRKPKEAFKEPESVIIQHGMRTLEFALVPVVPANQFDSFITGARKGKNDYNIMPALIPCSGRAFYWEVPDSSAAEIAQKGDWALVDRDLTVLRDECWYLVRMPTWAYPKLRKCKIRSNGIVLTVQKEEMPYEKAKVQIIGAVCNVTRPMSPDPRGELPE